MERQKKNKLFTFIFSLLPGAAEMYMGFMKTGFSMMIIFMCSFIIPSILRINELFMFFSGVIWFYSFFHARNLASCREDLFQKLPDKFVWNSFVNEENIDFSNPTVRKWGANSLIVGGVLLLWNNVIDIFCKLIPDNILEYVLPFIDRMPQIIISILLIKIGIQMIKGKKEELDGK